MFNELKHLTEQKPKAKWCEWCIYNCGLVCELDYHGFEPWKTRKTHRQKLKFKRESKLKFEIRIYNRDYCKYYKFDKKKFKYWKYRKIYNIEHLFKVKDEDRINPFVFQ